MGGIEAVHLQAGGGHVVQDGGFDMRMAVVTAFLPAVIVAHHEDDIGLVGAAQERGKRQEKRAEGEGVEAGGHERLFGCLFGFAFALFCWGSGGCSEVVGGLIGEAPGVFQAAHFSEQEALHFG